MAGRELEIAPIGLSLHPPAQRFVRPIVRFFDRRPIRNEYLIVDGGKLAGAGAHSYSAGDATGGSEEAEKFKNAN